MICAFVYHFLKTKVNPGPWFHADFPCNLCKFMQHVLGGKAIPYQIKMVKRRVCWIFTRKKNRISLSLLFVESPDIVWSLYFPLSGVDRSERQWHYAKQLNWKVKSYFCLLTGTPKWLRMVTCGKNYNRCPCYVVKLPIFYLNLLSLREPDDEIIHSYHLISYCAYIVSL